MKLKKHLLLGLSSVALYALSSCDRHDHDHDDHDHGPGEEHAGHDKDGDDHAHKAGPSGGRVLHEFEPHAEFFVLEDRKVQITFVDDDYKPIAAVDQSASIVAGDRSDPTMLAFTKQGSVLVSDKSLPASDNFPVVLQIGESSGAEKVTAKFQVDMNKCPDCDYLEYACTCDHAHEE